MLVSSVKSCVISLVTTHAWCTCWYGDHLCVDDGEWGCVDIRVTEHMGWLSQLGNNCPQNLLYISNKNN